MSKVSELARTIFTETSKFFPDKDQRIMQTLCVGEEAGEFVGAVRKYLGMARRSGDFDSVRYELADVIISAYVAAEALQFDVDAAIEEKSVVILTRGWKQNP